ncbi:VirB8/TrbF family protein [Mycobacterium sp. CVI_P3]|uniref:VirB8/TrbF family protein n=1 Tax=Mycobacterium pinniadriaticum TaxID=2994102 RepID=A0ABT3SDY1_9MYCO|nr:VirB8/TrbF family protein [Mycobacterium pinniadriaticum]MCX2931294.1 VirB8/TrbF family protein [Mycobacterium pinniadriaticum]MCX2937718.1 VirB8/TrbF family protein [Mycobacterium pinniadriaticum]
MAADVNEEAVSEALAELAEAEAAEAEARAEAARAKATAARLRGSASTDDAAASEEMEPLESTEDIEDFEDDRRGWWSRIGRLTVAVVLVVAVAVGSLVVTGMMVVAHQKVTAEQAHRAELIKAATTGVTALLSIDYNRAQADVQHVIDLSTGTFKDDFSRGADDFVKTAEQSKAVTVGSIKSAALDSDNGDTGVVLLAASSTVTNANGAHQDPRAWRMSVTVARDGDQYKMSNVEFVP